MSTQVLQFRHPKRHKCPRCGGSMALEFDKKTGYSRDCLNCGRVEYLGKSDPVPGVRDGRTVPNCWDITRPGHTAKPRR